MNSPINKPSVQPIPGLDRIMQAEQEITRVIPQMLKAARSAQLTQLLGQMLARSGQHLDELNSFCDSGFAQHSEDAPADPDFPGYLPDINNDLALTMLATGMIRRSISCYEEVSDKCEGTQQRNVVNIIGKALADELATDLFLQELAERLFNRQFSATK